MIVKDFNDSCKKTPTINPQNPVKIAVPSLLCLEIKNPMITAARANETAEAIKDQL